MTDPKPIPENNPVPFARLPQLGAKVYWPVRTNHPRAREVTYLDINDKVIGSIPARRFLAIRNNGTRYHVGIDLYGYAGDPVVACEDGILVNWYLFYQQTYAVLIEHNDIVINYAEITNDIVKNLKKGAVIKAGEVIGYLGKLESGSMCHFEIYRKGTTTNKRWLVGQPRPVELLNPTKYLLELSQKGL